MDNKYTTYTLGQSFEGGEYPDLVAEKSETEKPRVGLLGFGWFEWWRMYPEQERKTLEDFAGSILDRRLFEQARAEFGQIDFLVHAIAYASRESLSRPFWQTRRADFAQAMDISCYSLVALCQAMTASLFATWVNICCPSASPTAKMPFLVVSR
jgi:hypothetical protein